MTFCYILMVYMKHRLEDIQGKPVKAIPHDRVASEICPQVYKRCTGGNIKMTRRAHVSEKTSNNQARFIQ